MSVGLYTARITAEVLARNEVAARAYREFPDVSLHWCMVDLVGSSKYRLSQGPEKGYVRGETFFSLVDATTRPYGDLRVFKEIGDAVLMCAPSVRPLFEVCVLLNLASKQLAHIASIPDIPFGVRMGIDFGVAKKLQRGHEDYLGSAIDRLARLMTVRSDRTNIVISTQAVRHNDGVFGAEYKSFCSVSQAIRLPLPTEKQLIDPVTYHEIMIGHENAAAFNDWFVEWAKPTQPAN